MHLSDAHVKYINFETGEVNIPADLVKRFYCNNPEHANDMFEAADNIKPPCNCTNRSGSIANCDIESFWQKQLDDLLDGAWDKTQSDGIASASKDIGAAIARGENLDYSAVSSALAPPSKEVKDLYLKSAHRQLELIRQGPKPITVRRYFWQFRLKPESYYTKSNSNHVVQFFIRDLTGTNPDGTLHSKKPYVFIRTFNRPGKWYEGIFKDGWN